MPSGTNVILYNKLHRYPHLLPYRGSQMTKFITGPMHSARRFLYSHNPSHQCDKCLLSENGHPGFVMSFDKCRLARYMAAAAAIWFWATGFFQLWPPWPPKNAFCFDIITCNIFSPTQLTIHLIYSLFFFVFCCFLCQWLHYLIPCGVICCNNEMLTPWSWVSQLSRFNMCT